MQRTPVFVKTPWRHSENFTNYLVIQSSRSWSKMFHLRWKISLRKDSRGFRNSRRRMEATLVRTLIPLSIATEAWVTWKALKVDSLPLRTLQLLWNHQWIENLWPQLQTSRIVLVDLRNNRVAFNSIVTHLPKRVMKILSQKLNMKEFEPRWTILIFMRTQCPIKKRKRCKLILHHPICRTFSKVRQISTRKMSIWNQTCKEKLRTMPPSKLEVTRQNPIKWMIDKTTKMRSWKCSERLKRWTLIPQSRSNSKTFWSTFVDLRSVTSLKESIPS